MSGRRLVAVGSKKRVCRDEIGVSRVSKPTNTSNQTLIGFFAMLERRRIICFGQLGNKVDGYTRLVGICRGRLISVLEGFTFNEVSSKARQVEMNGH